VTAGYWARRLLRHALLMLAGAAVVGAMAASLGSTRAAWRLSMGTAWASLLLLGVSLVIGPLRVILRRPNPVTTDLRRDVGIWAAVLGLVHVVLGLQMHMKRRIDYFVYPPDQPHAFPLRHDLFGVASWTGLAATLVLLMLLAISNDVSLRKLGTVRWKALQRWSYALATLTLVHGAVFQVLEKRTASLVVVLGVVSFAVLVVQLAGARRVRRGGPRGPLPLAAGRV